MPSPQELEAAARLTAPLISEGADVGSFVGPPPPPVAVTDAESANDAECHDEVERILAPDIGNAYELLGLRVGATDESLKNRYWKLLLLVHPDRCTHPQAHEAFRALNQAIKDLQDAPKRSIIEQKIEKKETREEFQVDEEAEQRRQWQEAQKMLKRQLILEDDFSWKVNCKSAEPALRYIGGVDLSFFKKDPKVACGALVVVDLNTMDVIYEDLEIVHLSMPYIPGFLAFRESPVLVGLLRKLASKQADIYPQVLMVDGNGILHPRGFGLASHIGVLANIPTIGVAKNLYHVDGLSKEDLQMPCNITDATPLIGSSGQVLGMAIRSHQYCIKPIFVSIGHRISLSTAVDVVQKCCKYRIPEPVRQADIRSRKEIRVRFGM